MAVTWLATVVSRRIEGKRRVALVNLTTSGAGNTYTTGGDLAPSFGNLGMKRNVERIDFYDTSQEGYLYTYNQTTGRIKLYQDNAVAAAAPLGEVAAAAALNSKSVYAEVVGW